VQAVLFGNINNIYHVKYLKLFEDIHFFYQLNELDWINKARVAVNQEGFTEFEYQEIEKFFPKQSISKIIWEDESLEYSELRIDLVYENCKARIVVIIKVRDDWYYVSYSTKSTVQEYFKCDQFDGLINFLEEKKLGSEYEVSTKI
jgi:hypothetical protein